MNLLNHLFLILYLLLLLNAPLATDDAAVDNDDEDNADEEFPVSFDIFRSHSGPNFIESLIFVVFVVGFIVSIP